MKNFQAFVFAAVAAAAFCPMAMAAENVLLALNPVKAALKSELAGPATAQLKITEPGYTDFDALSAVNDPLYRAGSKALLQRESKGQTEITGKASPALRDAPNSKPVSVLKKPRIKKNIPADPVKIKNTL